MITPLQAPHYYFRDKNNKTFICYSGEDEDKANYIFRSLSRIIQIQPYKAEIHPNYGEDFKKRIESELSNSIFMIVLLTSNGIRSQWVNQEVGYACCLKTRLIRNDNDGLPYIIPISESGIELKGLITKDSNDILFLDKFPYFEDVIANIIWYLRKKIPNGLEEGVLKYRIACSNCTDEKGLPTEYNVLIPSYNNVLKAIKSNRLVWASSCDKCKTKNLVDIRTFLPNLHDEPKPKLHGELEPKYTLK